MYFAKQLRPTKGPAKASAGLCKFLKKRNRPVNDFLLYQKRFSRNGFVIMLSWNIFNPDYAVGFVVRGVIERKSGYLGIEA